MIRWFRRTSDVPEREQVVTAMKNLPALPEAAQMTHKPMQRAKPKTFDRWRGLYDWRKGA